MYYALLSGAILTVTAFSLLISMPLYITILVVIMKNRTMDPFNSEFFLIFVALGIADIVSYVLALTGKLFWFNYVPSFFMPCNQENVYVAIFRYPFLVFGILTYQSMFLLNLNRFIAIIFPIFYNQFWTTKATLLFIFGFFAIDLGICSPVFVSNAQIVQYTAEFDGINRTFAFGPITAASSLAKYLLYIWSGHVYALLISSVFLYSIMLLKLRGNGLISNSKKVELQLFLVGFIIFLVNVIYSTYLISKTWLFTGNDHSTEWIIYLFIADLYNLHNGFVLYFTSAKIREIVTAQVFKVLRFGSGTSSTSDVTFMTSSDVKDTQIRPPVSIRDI